MEILLLLLLLLYVLFDDDDCDCDSIDANTLDDAERFRYYFSTLRKPDTNAMIELLLKNIHDSKKIMHESEETILDEWREAIDEAIEKDDEYPRD